MKRPGIVLNLMAAAFAAPATPAPGTPSNRLKPTNLKALKSLVVPESYADSTVRVIPAKVDTGGHRKRRSKGYRLAKRTKLLAWKGSKR